MPQVEMENGTAASLNTLKAARHKHKEGMLERRHSWPNIQMAASISWEAFVQRVAWAKSPTA